MFQAAGSPGAHLQQAGLAAHTLLYAAHTPHAVPGSTAGSGAQQPTATTASGEPTPAAAAATTPTSTSTSRAGARVGAMGGVVGGVVGGGGPAAGPARSPQPAEAEAEATPSPAAAASLQAASLLSMGSAQQQQPSPTCTDQGHERGQPQLQPDTGRHTRGGDGPADTTAAFDTSLQSLGDAPSLHSSLQTTCVAVRARLCACVCARA